VAARSGDRFLASQLEISVLPIVHLTDDDAPGARAVLEGALAHWPRPPLSLVHWTQSQTRALVELYAGEPAAALAVMEGQMTSPEQKLFSRMKVIQVFSLFVHANALVGVAARRPEESAALLQRAERDIQRIDATRIAPDCVALLRGQIAFLNGDPAAVDLFARAEALLAKRGMRLLRLVAAHGRGVAQGGATGRTNVEETWRQIQANEIRSPAGLIRLFAPAVADP
jgi:hypothetical protein